MEHHAKIRIVLADDQTMIRQGLRYIINAQPDMEVVGETADGADAVNLIETLVPDLVLMDIQMPKQTGIEATRHILKVLPAIKVILLTTFDVQEYVFDGIRAGAIGYLLKDADTQELLESIRSAYQGAAIYRSASAGKALAQAVSFGNSAETGNERISNQQTGNEQTGNEQAGNEQAGNEQAGNEQAGGILLDPLTEREIDVLQQMAYGKRNFEIAQLLCVSEGTVKTHVHRILQKLDVEDRTQAVVLAIRQHIVK